MIHRIEWLPCDQWGHCSTQWGWKHVPDKNSSCCEPVNVNRHINLTSWYQALPKKVNALKKVSPKAGFYWARLLRELTKLCQFVGNDGKIMIQWDTDRSFSAEHSCVKQHLPLFLVSLLTPTHGNEQDGEQSISGAAAGSRNSSLPLLAFLERWLMGSMAV